MPFLASQHYLRPGSHQAMMKYSPPPGFHGPFHKPAPAIPAARPIRGPLGRPLFRSIASRVGIFSWSPADPRPTRPSYLGEAHLSHASSLESRRVTAPRSRLLGHRPIVTSHHSLSGTRHSRPSALSQHHGRRQRREQGDKRARPCAGPERRSCTRAVRSLHFSE